MRGMSTRRSTRGATPGPSGSSPHDVPQSGTLQDAQGSQSTQSQDISTPRRGPAEMEDALTSATRVLDELEEAVRRKNKLDRVLTRIRELEERLATNNIRY
jgi:hypothetical protein